MKIIDIAAVAQLVGLSEATIRNQVFRRRNYASLRGFPAPARRKPGHPLAWVDADVAEWIASQRTTVCPTPTAPRRGRPRMGGPK